MTPPETKIAFYRLVHEHLRQHFQKFFFRKTDCQIDNVQLYLEVDINKLVVTLKTRDRIIATFHKSPTLADAVIRARKFRQDHYPENQTLEYIK